MSDGKVQLEAELDASRVKQGAAEVTGAVRQMGRDVEQEGRKLKDALDIGDAGNKASERVAQSSRSIIGQIQRQTAVMEAGTRGSREYYESIARQRGIGAEVLKPYLDQLDATKAKLEANKAAQDAVNASMKSMGDSAGGSMRGAAAEVDKLSGSFVSLRGAVTAAATALAAYVTIDAAKAILDQADAVSLLNSRLRLAVGGADEFAAAQQGLFQLAQSNSVGLSETITLYTRLADPIKRLGGGMNEVIGVTNAFQKALQLGGVSAQEAASATLQFGQALGAGVLAGDEFRSLAEASPRLLKAIADGANLPIESLKKLGSEGKLTAEVVSNALLSMGGQLEAEFSQMPDTVGKSMTRLQNEVTRAIGEMNENTNLTLGVASMVDEASKLIPLFYNELGGAIQAVGGWLQENKDWIVATIESTKGLIADVWNVGKAAMSVAGAFGGWIGQVNIVATAITGIRILLAGVQDGVRILAGTFSWLGGVIISAVLAPVQAVIRGLSAAASLLGKAEWSASLNSASAAMLNFSTAGIKAGEGIYREFSNGQTALNQLRASMGATAKETTAAGAAAALAGGGFRSLKGSMEGADDAAKKAKKSAKEAKDEFADLLNKLTAKDIGISPDFYKNLNILYDGFNKGRIGVDEYRTAVERLIAEQQFAKDIARQLADEHKRLEDARKKELDAAVKSVDALRDGNAKLREEIDTLGMSRAQKVAYTQAINDATIAKLEEKAATLGLFGAEGELLAQIRAQITALQDRNALLGRKEVVEAQIEANKKMVDEAQKTADSINQSLTDALMRGFEDGKGFASNFRDTLKNMFRTLVLRPIISFVVQPIGNAISGMVSGFLGGGQGGAGGILGGASNLYSAWNMLSGTGGNLGAITGLVGGNMSFANAAGSIYANTTGTGISGLLSTNGAYGTAGSAAGMSSAAAGLAAIAAPLIVGSLIERNSRDRFSGAAYATSGGNDPFVNTVAGSTSFNYLTGDLPDRAALLARLEELGAPMEAISDWNDRALTYLMESTAGNNSEFGINWLPRIRNMESTPDFYRGQGYAHPEELGWWNNKDNANLSTDPALIQASRDIALSIIGPLEGIGALIGDEAAYRATVGFANRGEGNGVWAGMNLQRDGQNVADWVNTDDFQSVGEAVRAMYSTALGTLDSFDLPGWADKQVTAARAALDALEGENMGQEAAALYAQTTAGIEQMYRSIQMLIDVFPDFSDATQDSMHALQALMGGMDQLQGAYSSYLQNFWSDEERADLMRKQLGLELGKVGLSLPTTRDAFRDLVEAQDLSTEAGREAFAALMRVAGAFAEITPAAESAADAAARLAEEARKLAEEDYSNARSHTDDVWNRLNQLFNEQIDNWRGLAGEARKIFDLAGNAARQLRGGVDSTRLQDARTANAYIDQALAGLRASGALPDADELGRAIEGARAGLTMDGYVSVAEFERDQLILAGRLGELGDTAGVQLSFAEQQVNLLEQQRDFWRKQLDAMRGDTLLFASIDEGVTLLADALRAEQAAKDAARDAAQNAAQNSGGGRGAFGGGPGGGPGRTPAQIAAEAEALREQDWWGGGDWYRLLGWRLDVASEATGISPDDLAEYLAKLGMQTDGGIIMPRFAAGGLHSGGLRVVGERGWELEATGPSRIWNQQQLHQVLTGGGSNNAELADLLRQVLRELGAIRADTKETSDLTYQQLSLNKRLTSNGSATRVEVLTQ